MDTLLPLAALALALALGFVLGVIVGARRAYTIILGGRAVRQASARIGRFMPATMPQRTAADMLAGRVRILLGATTYDLPVLARGPSRRWLEHIDARFATLALDLEQAGDDAPAILARLISETDALYELLRSYDQSGILPSRADIDEEATDAQVLQAVLEVWRAVHPLVATLSDSARPPISGTSSEPLSS